MFHTVSQIEPIGAPRDLELSDRTKRRLVDGVPINTRRGYQGDRERFERWCQENNRSHLPATPQTLTEYVSHLADGKTGPATIRRAITSIRTQHTIAGFDPPMTKGALIVLKEYRKSGDAPRAVPSAPLLLADLRKVIDHCAPPDTPGGARDRALIVLGWVMMARRSEIAALNVDDVLPTAEGLEVLVVASKTDQDADGCVVTVPYGGHPETCPVRLTTAWIDLVGAPSGPLFRPVDRHGRIGGREGFAGRYNRDRLTGQAVHDILTRAVGRAGLPGRRVVTDEHGRKTPGFTAHSLRSGSATTAYREGADLLAIARHGRWMDGSPVLLRYIRSVDKWKENPMRGVGL
jgi:integrase